MNRRAFIKRSSTGALMLAASGVPLDAFPAGELTKLTILHTNDVHSRIDPFPMDGSRNQGLGGASRRAAMINEIRKEANSLLLLDAGDIFQGTPYFNVFGGELEFKLMSQMGYDAATIGNHDFDAGIDGLVKQLQHTNFPFVVSNYDVDDSLLANKVQKYITIQKDDLKIGILGLGIELRGLVFEHLYGNVRYVDPVRISNEIAGRLKNDLNCDYVICLSHLGYKYNRNQVSDLDIARHSSDIDLIIGGHTHTFMKEPHIIPNRKSRPVTINQVGWAGILLGRLDVTFEKNRKNRCLTCKNLLVSPNA